MPRDEFSLSDIKIEENIVLAAKLECNNGDRNNSHGS